MAQDSDLQTLTFKMLLKSEYLFYGLFLSEVNKGFSKKIPTACLGKHPNSPMPFMWFNPDFWDGLKNDEERMFLLLHEVGHLIGLSFIFQKEMGLEHEIFNLAADMNINSMIMRDHKELQMPGGKDGGILPSTFPELKLEDCRDSIYYYNALRQGQAKKEGSKGTDDSLAGPPGNKKGSSGCKNLDGMLDSGLGKDLHSLWGELCEGMSDVEKEVFKRDLIQKLQQIADETEASRGLVPAGMEGIRDKIKILKPTVNWKSVFRNFIGSAVSQEQYATWKKPNFRYPDARGVKFKTKTKIFVGADSSGSVSDLNLNHFHSELHQIWKSGAVEVDFAAWDAEVGEVKKYDGRLNLERTKCGGTEASCCVRYINEHFRKENYSVAIILTDGYVESEITHCKIPTLFLITPEGNTELGTKHKVLRMK